MPQRSTFEVLKSRAEELFVDRSTTENTWQQIADNTVGRRNFTVHTEPGRQRMQRIYDDTAKVSSSLLSGAIHSLLVSPLGRWFELVFESAALRDDAQAVDWLKQVEKRMYAALSAPSANFHSQLSEMFHDLIDFGTGGLFIEDVPGQGIRFSARALQELYLATDPSGRIDTVVRKFQLTARQAVTEWGDKPVAANKDLNGQNNEGKKDYIHIILPNDDVILGNHDVSGKPWASFFLSIEDKAIMDEGGFHELPIVTPRWEVDPGEVFGRGPGWNALSNQKMLNQLKLISLKAGQKAVDPPMLVDNKGVLAADLRFEPNSIIPVNSMLSGLNPPVQPVPSASNFAISQAMIEDTRKAVQDSYHHQLIETIRDPRMTATQVLELSAQMQRHLAPILGRLTTELLGPIVDRVFAIESRAGRLPETPENVSGESYEVDYVSPVARAQQTSEARAIIDFAGVAKGLIEADPEVAFVVDFKAAARELASALGVPPIMIRDSKQVALQVAAASEQAAQEEQQAQALAAVDAVSKLAKSQPQQQAAA